jgi:hypothetical protein
MFDKIARRNNFLPAFGAWYKESAECIAILELQKSHFGNYYQLVIKIFIQRLFDKNYTINKDLIKKEVGHVNNGEPQEFRSAFNLDFPLTDIQREEELEKLFLNHINPFMEKSLSITGIKKLEKQGDIILLPAIKMELGI